MRHVDVFHLERSRLLGPAVFGHLPRRASHEAFAIEPFLALSGVTFAVAFL